MDFSPQVSITPYTLAGILSCLANIIFNDFNLSIPYSLIFVHFCRRKKKHANNLLFNPKMNSQWCIITPCIQLVMKLLRIIMNSGRNRIIIPFNTWSYDNCNWSLIPNSSQSIWNCPNKLDLILLVVLH